ncbi:SIMPL domain-containing protein [Polymorphobacter multimanifer]|uniref:SIMPL domain-containing protein n=1 Tax=Polymorphobacter multimanifer TaxID=1070431 RepID=A0A841L7T2_9SPHN|nr:SIMPL domain-containing protein [Polymorphobacter multimanifer]MBB6227013.1 hypothetical protein [Polymorphobacter multimanifer]
MTTRLAALAALALLATPALAQVPPAELGARYVPAPWWMREPIIASIGMVRTELPANRAQFGARFSAVERTSDAALAAAAAKVREIDAVLRSQGADRVRIATTFRTTPLYEQYKDKEGNLQTNDRADKIERYEVQASILLEVRDLAALESAYAAVVAARPQAIDPVRFNLEPDNAAKTFLQVEAVKDATRRARAAAEATGSRMGPVKVIDPTGRACRTDVLAGWPSYGRAEARTDVEYAAPPPPPPPAPQSIMVTGRRVAGEPAVQVSLQPPFEALEDDACVVFALLP